MAEITLSNITHLFDLIDTQIKESNIPEKKKKKMAKIMKDFAYQGFKLGSTGSLAIKVEEE